MFMFFHRGKVEIMINRIQLKTFVHSGTGHYHRQRTEGKEFNRCLAGRVFPFAITHKSLHVSLAICQLRVTHKNRICLSCMQRSLSCVSPWKHRIHFVLSFFPNKNEILFSFQVNCPHWKLNICARHVLFISQVWKLAYFTKAHFLCSILSVMPEGRQMLSISLHIYKHMAVSRDMKLYAY